MKLPDFETLLFDGIKKHIDKNMLYNWEAGTYYFDYQIEVDGIVWEFKIKAEFDGYTSEFDIDFKGVKEDGKKIKHEFYLTIITNLERKLNETFSA
jgi:hypothetical protein